MPWSPPVVRISPVVGSTVEVPDPLAITPAPIVMRRAPGSVSSPSSTEASTRLPQGASAAVAVGPEPWPYAGTCPYAGACP